MAVESMMLAASAVQYAQTNSGTASGLGSAVPAAVQVSAVLF